VVAYGLDQDYMKLRHEEFFWFQLGFRLILTFVITLAVLYLGSLLTTALLVFPVFWARNQKNGVVWFLAFVTLIGFIGALVGYFTGIMTDMPISYTASVGIFMVGILSIYAQILLFKAR
jgi:ABC-type Mn2+/Zn2+ transport system permease subunit